MRRTLIILAVGLLVAGAAPAAELFVATNGSDGAAGTLAAPLATLDEARQRVRTLLTATNADITVWLRGGTYALTGTVAFVAADGPTNGTRVTYASFSNEWATLSGGRELGGWTVGSGGVWQASAQGLRFRQLYVNGRRAVRARQPNVGSFYRLTSWDRPNRRVSIPPGLVTNWGQLGAVEFVVNRHWDQHNLRLAAAYDAGGVGYLEFQQPERERSFLADYPQAEPNQAFYFENAREFLDTPGEWHLDVVADQVTYRPRAGETPSNSTVVVPQVETLIAVRGTADAPVRNLTFRNLNLQHSTWLRPDAEGYVSIQTGIMGDSPTSTFDTNRMPASVEVWHAQGVTFEGLDWRWLGASALNLRSGVVSNAVRGCTVFDLAGNGVAVDLDLVANPPDARTRCRDNRIENNWFSRVGQDYSGCEPIYASFVSGLEVAHNTIRDCPYIGIQVGWGWTLADTALASNRVSRNSIGRVMQRHDDGGGIYTLSKQPGTEILFNHIFDIVRAAEAEAFPIAAIYLDNGSSFMRVASNVVQNVVQLGYEQLGAPVAENNTWVDNVSQDAGIIAAAGLEPAFASAAADTDAPVLLGVTTTAVNVVRVEFSEPISPGCVTLDHFALTPPIGIATVATQSLGEVVVLTLDAPLSTNTAYALTASRIADRARVPNLLAGAARALGGAAGGTDWFVTTNGSDSADGGSWTTAFATIQKGIDSASTGDTVTVGGGTYRVQATIALTNDVTVRSVGGAAATILDANASIGDYRRVIRVASSNAVLEGFTLRGGYVDGANGLGEGGAGVALQAGMVRHCTIEGNVAHDSSNWSAWGGGATVGGTAVLLNCVIRSNQVLHCSNYGGAGVYMGGGTVRGCLIYANSCAAFGGGIYVDGGRIESCTLTRNFGTLGGGGVGWGNVWGTAAVLNSIVYFNNTTGTGATNLYSLAAAQFTCAWPEVTGAGNTAADPGFQRAGDGFGIGATLGDPRPMVQSPCRDTGSNQAWMTNAFDLTGRPRLLGARVDLGSYEVAVKEGLLLEVH
jgi:hypothetical protein